MRVCGSGGWSGIRAGEDNNSERTIENDSYLKASGGENLRRKERRRTLILVPSS